MEGYDTADIDPEHPNDVYLSNPNELQYIATNSSAAVTNTPAIESNLLTMNTGPSLICNTTLDDENLTSDITMPEESTVNVMPSAITNTDPWMNQSQTTTYFSEMPVNAPSNPQGELANVIAEPPVGYILLDSAPSDTDNVFANVIAEPAPVNYILLDQADCNSEFSGNIDEYSFIWTPYQQFQEDNQQPSDIPSNEPLITYQSDHYLQNSQVALQALPPPSICNDSPNFLVGPTVSTYSGHCELLESTQASVGNVNQCAPSWQINQYEACLNATSSELQVQEDGSQLHSHVNQDEFQPAESSLQESIDYQSESNENYECEHVDLGYQESDYTGGVQFESGEDSIELPKQSQLEKPSRSQKTEKPLQCDVCQRIFLFPSDLKRHMRCHTGEKPYKCNLCSREFSRLPHLKMHWQTHTGEKPYQCDLCSKHFASRSLLKSHKRVHTGEKPYKCDLCSRKFSQAAQLRKHRRTHTGEKPYQCDLCSKNFARRCHLKTHRQTHTGEKTYQCDVCSKNLSSRYRLKTHKLVHTGQKPYQCDLCPKKFSQQTYLTSHRRMHTGPETYKCDLCSKQFAYLSCMTLHKRTHNGEQ